MFSKNVNNKKCAPKMVFLSDFFLKLWIIFDNFYSTDHKTYKFLKGLVVGLGPNGRPGRMCNFVH